MTRIRFGTNFPSVPRAKQSVNKGRPTPKRKGKKSSRRRTASQLLTVAGRDAEAWHRRTIDYPSTSSSGGPLPAGGGAGSYGEGRHRAPSFGYRILPLTREEYTTLIWLAERGYDANILKTAGVEKELPDGRVVLGRIPEHKAWEINERVNNDPHAFLTSCNSRGLKEKLDQFIDSIV